MCLHEAEHGRQDKLYWFLKTARYTLYKIDGRMAFVSPFDQSSDRNRLDK